MIEPIRHGGRRPRRSFGVFVWPLLIVFIVLMVLVTWKPWADAEPGPMVTDVQLPTIGLEP